MRFSTFPLVLIGLSWAATTFCTANARAQEAAREPAQDASQTAPTSRDAEATPEAPSPEVSPPAPASADVVAPAPASAQGAEAPATSEGGPEPVPALAVEPKANDAESSSASTAGPPGSPREDQADDLSNSIHVRVRGRVIGGFEVERKHPTSAQTPIADGTEPGFFLNQARLKIEGEVHERVRTVISVDFDRGASLQDAYVNWKPEKEAQLRFGRFRRPFSRLANQSRASLPFRSRGLYDDLIMDDQNWGDRTLGLMLHGKPMKRVRYYAAVMSPAAVGSGIEGADVIVRGEYEVVKDLLKVGLGGQHKWTERFEDGPNLSLNGVTADVALEAAGFYTAVEGTAAQNPNPPRVPSNSSPRTPFAVGVIGYAGYYAPLAPELYLGPLGLFEWMDPDIEYGQDARIRGVFGLAMTFQDRTLRVLPQVELIRPIGKVTARSQVAEDNYYVQVTAEF